MTVRSRIGIIGAGFWAATFYLPSLRDREDVEVVGVVGLDQAVLGALKSEYGLGIASPRHEELLDAGCDGIIVASPHRFHAAHAIAALESGAHVLVEKPMALTHRDALAVSEAAVRAGRHVTLPHGWNYTRMMRWADGAMEANALGSVTAITGYMASALTGLFSGRSGYGTIEVRGVTIEAQSQTWADPSGGGGYLYGQFPHLLGAALLLARDEPETVYCDCVLGEAGVELDVSVSVRFASGAIGTFSGNSRLPWGQRQSMDLRIAGERGVLAIDMERERAEMVLAGNCDEPEVARLEPEVRPREGLYNVEGALDHFLRMCAGEDDPDYAPARVGVQAVAVLEAATRSALTGLPVAVNDL